MEPKVAAATSKLLSDEAAEDTFHSAVRAQRGSAGCEFRAGRARCCLARAAKIVLQREMQPAMPPRVVPDAAAEAAAADDVEVLIALDENLGRVIDLFRALDATAAASRSASSARALATPSN